MDQLRQKMDRKNFFHPCQKGSFSLIQKGSFSLYSKEKSGWKIRKLEPLICYETKGVKLVRDEIDVVENLSICLFPPCQSRQEVLEAMMRVTSEIPPLSPKIRAQDLGVRKLKTEGNFRRRQMQECKVECCLVH